MLSTLSGLGGQPLTLKADPTVPINTNGVSQDIGDRMRAPAQNLQIGYGPIKGGFFNNDETASTVPNPLLNSNFDATIGIVGGQQLPNRTGTQMPLGGTSINNVGIDSLTQNPISSSPESSITGLMSSSGYFNNNQELDQYLNSYVENLINRRMRDLFGGIMSIFQ